ncbi:MAG TPA: hypothetical protein VMU81_27470 [Acetobacteraceae bacterium]|nr:hypothetical protein [Acetobacteraceae bacterium]
MAELDAADVRHVQDNPDNTAPRRTSAIRNAVNEKYIGPDWVHFDVREKGWNEIIGAHTQLYELKPVIAER